MIRPAVRLTLAPFLVALAALWSAPALAQGFGPRPGGPGGGAPEKKPEGPAGPAEAAPEEKEGEPEIPPLPAWPGQETRKLEFLQMHGYFRFRWNMHHNLSNGLLTNSAQTTGVGTNPYSSYNPISEDFSSTLPCSTRAKDASRGMDPKKCPASTIGGADMRLRIEPTINVTEQIRIYTQFDIFDNLVLGSTPRSLADRTVVPDVPMAAFSDGQAAPVVGENTNRPAILAKRAWAEIDLHSITTLRFGRMPDQWGMGLFRNDGNVKADNSCWNCNFGDSEDRIMLQSNVAQHTFAIGYDFSSSGPNSLTVANESPYYGVNPVDLEKLDDVHQFFWMAARIDPEDVILDKMERGEAVFNYGLYLFWRKQDFDYATKVSGLNQGLPGLNSPVTDYADRMIERHAWMLMPDLWVKLLWKKLYIEFEGALIGGTVNNPEIADASKVAPAVNILEFGWALRSEYRFLKDSLKIGLDAGMASGDEDEPANGDVNRSHYAAISNKTRGGWLTEFRFNYDYQVDWILFREIVGTVSNATYFKPHISYDILETLGARFDMIYSIANKPVGWPGNARNLGVELDLEAYYKNVKEGFYAGLVYGVLFPLQALARPLDIYGVYGNTGAGFDPGAAHTFQGRLFVRF